MKRGFTLIEVIITLVIIGIFMVVCIPCVNKINQKFNSINNNQIDCLNKISFYQQVSNILSNSKEIYYESNEKLIITINNHKLIKTNDNKLYVDDIDYNVEVTKVVVNEKYIFLNLLFNEQEQSLILRGKVYEISSS